MTVQDVLAAASQLSREEQLQLAIGLLESLGVHVATELDDYFLFLAPDDIRVKGTRVGIETILYDYIYRSRTPEEVAKTYPSLSLEQVYATIFYYLRHQEQVSQYMANWLAWGHRMREEQKQRLSTTASKLQQLRAERLLSGQSYANQVFDG